MFGLFGLGFFGTAIVVTALIHFVMRRPDTYWLFVILFLGPIGALIYLAVEALPEFRDPGAFKFLDRRKRQRELEGLIHANPSAGNYEELGQIYLDEGKWSRARECFDRSLAQRADSIDPFYRRAIAEVELGDFAAARDDLERVYAKDKEYDFYRAAGLLAYAVANTGEVPRAESIYRDVLRMSTLTETQLHYAEFLAKNGRKDEAREWINRILAKRRSMPGFLRRKERPLFRKVRILSATM